MPTRSKYGIPVEFTKPPMSKDQKKDKKSTAKAAKAAKDAQRAEEEEEEEERKQKEERKAAREAKKEDPELRERREEEEKQTAHETRLKDERLKGDKAFQEGDMTGALTCYSQCVELEPTDPIHWSNRSVVQRQLYNFEEALEDAKKCVELDKEFAKGWLRVGQAHVALENLDEADEAFKEGLTLEPDSQACKDGLKEVAEIRAASEEERAFDRLAAQLQAMSVEEVEAFAVEQGLDEKKVQAAGRSGEPKEALVCLVTAYKYLIGLVTAELEGLDEDELEERALDEDDLDPDDIATASVEDDPVAALTALLVRFQANDLVDIAVDVQKEAARDCDEDEDEDEAEQQNDLDFEVVTIDESKLQLAEGEVFIPGAHIDPKYGELVLPNGHRLGNRALKRFYRQRAGNRATHAVALHSGGRQALHNFTAKIMRQQERRMNIKQSGLTMASRTAVSTQLQRSIFKQKEADNKAMRAIVHHWGAGGGGSHYHSCGGKQFQKGNKVKGVILRHSTQGAKMQAARNKKNRGNKSQAVLK